MKFLFYDEKELKSGLIKKGFLQKYDFDDFARFKEKYFDTIKLIRDLIVLLESEKIDYYEYENCSSIESNIYWGGDYCLNDLSKILFVEPEKYISPLSNILKQIKARVVKILNSSDGENLGKFTELIDDIEESMKFNNFYDFFFLTNKAEDEIEDLGFNYFQVEDLKRKMHKKLNLYKNTIVQYYPGVIRLWETIRHNLAMEDAADSLAGAQMEIADANWEIAEAQKDLVKATCANVVATMGVAVSNTLIASELNTIKKIQIAGTVANAYEALQLRKIKKKILGEI